MISSQPAPNSNPITIREMQHADAREVSELAQRIWREHYVPHIVSAGQIDYMLPRVASEQWFADACQTKSHHIYLLYADKTLVGYIALNTPEKHNWFIDKLYVDTNTQRSGLGSALLTHAQEKLKPRVINLRVNRKNFGAVNFYFKHGFKITATDEKDIGGGFFMDDFIMEKQL